MVLSDVLAAFGLAGCAYFSLLAKKYRERASREVEFLRDVLEEIEKLQSRAEESFKFKCEICGREFKELPYTSNGALAFRKHRRMNKARDYRIVCNRCARSLADTSPDWDWESVDLKTYLFRRTGGVSGFIRDVLCYAFPYTREDAAKLWDLAERLFKGQSRMDGLYVEIRRLRVFVEAHLSLAEEREKREEKKSSVLAVEG
jgi:hypothetical protein